MANHVNSNAKIQNDLVDFNDAKPEENFFTHTPFHTPQPHTHNYYYILTCFA